MVVIGGRRRETGVLVELASFVYCQAVKPNHSSCAKTLCGSTSAVRSL